MRKNNTFGLILSGFAAGAVGGLFGAGGGMVLIPLLGLLTPLEDHEIFSSSIAIILPVCTVSIIVTSLTSAIPWHQTFPYLLGSGSGGILAAIFGRKIPSVWLHKALGLLIIWGGIRYLC